MMPLNLMNRILKTVDSAWRSPLIESMLERWIPDRDSIYYLRASANAVFIFRCAGKPRYFWINASTERYLNELEAEMALLNDLHEQGIPVVKPIRSEHGRLVETFDTGIAVFHGVVFEGIDGSSTTLDSLDATKIEAWGESLGKLHEAWKRTDRIYARQTLTDHIRMIDDVLPTEDKPERRLFDNIRRRLNRLIPSKENYGLIHYDFELDNLILGDDGFHIIDFDDCMYSFYVADIAYALREILDHGDILDRNIFDRFILGYRKATAISDHMLGTMPLFAALHDLMTYVRLKRAVEINENDPLDPRLLPVRTRLQEIILELRRSFG